ncbi:unnamed protein product [Arabidopsis halleri]
MVDIFPLKMLFGRQVGILSSQVHLPLPLSLLSSVDCSSLRVKSTDRWPAFSLSFGLFDTAERNEPNLTCTLFS